MLHTLRTSILAIALVACFVFSTPAAFAVDELEKTPLGVDVQARGPIHEAFARPSNAVAAPGEVVPQKPLPPIPELPPKQKPDGAFWIPGYWGWDAEKNDFLWISGVWRVPPPNRTWVPGYWGQADGGYQYVAGLWRANDQEEPNYLEQGPPASLEAGPSSPAPDDNSSWVPGSWVYTNDGYRWRPGYWLANNPGWVWNASEYAWTPGGYVYNPGYWDYPLDDRGVCFAPVRLSPDFSANSGSFYQPSYAWSFGNQLSSLFVRSGYGSYYCGNYFGANYFNNFGYTPWFAHSRRHYDPLFNNYRARLGSNYNGWYNNLHNTYMGRRNGTLPQLPTTLAQQNILNQNVNNNLGTQVVRPFNQIQNNVRLSGLNQTQLAAQQSAAQTMQSNGLHRLQTEATRATQHPGASVPQGGFATFNRSMTSRPSPTVSLGAGQQPAYQAPHVAQSSPAGTSFQGVRSPTIIQGGSRSAPGVYSPQVYQHLQTLQQHHAQSPLAQQPYAQPHPGGFALPNQGLAPHQGYAPPQSFGGGHPGMAGMPAMPHAGYGGGMPGMSHGGYGGGMPGMSHGGMAGGGGHGGGGGGGHGGHR